MANKFKGSHSSTYIILVFRLFHHGTYRIQGDRFVSVNLFYFIHLWVKNKQVDLKVAYLRQLLDFFDYGALTPVFLECAVLRRLLLFLVRHCDRVGSGIYKILKMI